MWYLTFLKYTIKIAWLLRVCLITQAFTDFYKHKQKQQCYSLTFFLILLAQNPVVGEKKENILMY